MRGAHGAFGNSFALPDIAHAFVPPGNGRGASFDSLNFLEISPGGV
jgi:hypothetical protein